MQQELDRKLPKSNWVSVQTEPLKQPATFTPHVGDLGTAAPPYEEPSNAATDTVVYPDEGYDYGAHYGRFWATRFNSSQVTDDEADARAEYRYQQHHYPTLAPGYVGAYSVPYSDPNAQGQGLCASHVEPQRESQAPQALNRMERIMERMEHQQAAASSASSQQFQGFIGQGELISLISLKFLKIYSFCIMILSMEFVECYTLCSTLWKEVGRPPACLRPVPNYVSGFVPRRGLVAPKCVILNIV
jgi:hypothetical protein